MPPSIRTARTTGLFYLCLAVAGALGFLLIRPRLFVSGNPGATLANLVEHATLARVGVALELLIVVAQALAAVWFYLLFRTADPVAAAGIAAFGLVNAVVILISAAVLATAAQLAAHPIGDAATTVQVLYSLSENLWTAGGLFFGLWLWPMGRCVLRSGWLPRPLGWILIAGCVGYLLGAFTAALAPDARSFTDLFALPATVGELWIVGYLLIRGVRREADSVPVGAGR